MYVAKQSPPPTDHADTLRNQISLQIPGPGGASPYRRTTTTTDTTSADVAIHARPTKAISEEGQKIIDGHLQVLMNCANGTNPAEPSERLLCDYYNALIEHDPNQDRIRMASSLNSMRGVTKAERNSALRLAQCNFDFGTRVTGSDNELLRNLKVHGSSDASDFVAAMRVLWTRALFNSNTMKALHAAAASFAKGGGEIRRVRPDAAGEFLEDLIWRHASDADTYHVLEVMLTLPRGYAEQRRGDQIVVLHNPVGPTTAELGAQAAREVDQHSLQPPSSSRKRPVDSTDWPGAVKHRTLTWSIPFDSWEPPRPSAGDGWPWESHRGQALPGEVRPVLAARSDTAPGAESSRVFYQPPIDDISSGSEVNSAGGNIVATTDADVGPLTLPTQAERSGAVSEVGILPHAVQAQFAPTRAAPTKEEILELVEYLKAPFSPTDMANGAWNLDIHVDSSRP